MTTWSFAIDALGRLNIVMDGALPPADNVLHVPVDDRGGLLVIGQADRARLATLLGDPGIVEVVRETGPRVADALDDALLDIKRIVQRRIDLARGDEPEEGVTP